MAVADANRPASPESVAAATARRLGTPRPEPVTRAADDVSEVVSIRDPEIDVDAIMAKIRASIASKREAGLLRDEAWLTQRLDETNLPGSARRSADRLALIQMAGRLNLAGDPIKSHRPLLGRLVVTFKRFSRYWIRKYTDQIFTRQTHYNSEVLQMLMELVHDNERLRERVEQLERDVGERRDVS